MFNSKEWFWLSFLAALIIFSTAVMFAVVAQSAAKAGFEDAILIGREEERYIEDAQTGVPDDADSYLSKINEFEKFRRKWDWLYVTVEARFFKQALFAVLQNIC